MAQIFISHSRYDEDIRRYFDEIFAGTKVKAVRLEFESFNYPASKFVIKQILKSDAFFVLLGPKISQKVATQSWVGFEMGAAAMRQIPCPIWVFEPIKYAPIKFPIPFLNNYMLYDLTSRGDRKHITSIVNCYRIPFAFARKITIPKWRQVNCPHDDCKMSYNLHGKVKEINCPACRKKIHLPT